MHKRNLDKSREGDIIRDHAQVGATGNADVTSLTPASAPRVADNPVRGSVTNGLDTVIDLVVALGQDATSVGLEGVSGKADSGGTSVQSGFEVGLTRRDSLVAGDLGDELGRVGLARAGLTSSARDVRVGGFSLDTASKGDVVKGVFSPATLAAIRSGVTRSDLLRSQHLKGVLASDLTIRFNGGSGAKSPARTALTLVLDGGHSTVVAPVNVVGNGAINDGGDASHVGVVTRAVVQKASAEFINGQVRELGDTKDGFARGQDVFSVLLVGLVDVVLEDGETVSFFSFRVLLAVVDLEVLPSVEVGSIRSGGDDASESENSGDRKSVV